MRKVCCMSARAVCVSSLCAVSVTREALVKQERARAVGIVKNASGQIYKWLLR